MSNVANPRLHVTSPSLIQQAIGAAITVLSPLVDPDVFVDALGNKSQAPAMRSVYSDQRPVYPHIAINYRPGQSWEHLAENLAWIDSDRVQHFVQYDEDGEIEIIVRAKSQGQRDWIHDWMDSGIRNACVVDPNTGALITGVVGKNLQALKMQMKGRPRTNRPAPDISDPERPAGQRWDAMLSICVDYELDWSSEIPADSPLLLTGVTFRTTPTDAAGTTYAGSTIVLPGSQPLVLGTPAPAHGFVRPPT